VLPTQTASPRSEDCKQPVKLTLPELLSVLPT